MPAFYAHYRFGREVSRRMQGDLKEIITKNYTQFAIGLQGPDIFFFCRPWCGRINRYGNHLHQISARPFFYHAQRVIRQAGRDSTQYAYLMGFICHFILDSECHSYVNRMVEETGVHHLEIEEEFEKYLLRMDGRDPLAFPMADLIPTDSATAAAIAPFYARGITDSIVKRSLKDLRLIKKLFTAPCPLKQNLINGLFHLSGHYAGMKGLMNQRIDNPDCRTSNTGLLLLYDQAVDLAVEMIESYDSCLAMETGESHSSSPAAQADDGHSSSPAKHRSPRRRLRQPLDPRFDRNFE